MRDIFPLFIFAISFSEQNYFDEISPDTQSNKSYEISKISSPPIIDGLLEDAAWEGIPIISDFIQYIRNIRKYSSHTIRSYCHDLNEYYIFCKDYDPEREFICMDHTAIQSYLQFLSRKGLSAKTLARRLASIKSLYKYMLINHV